MFIVTVKYKSGNVSIFRCSEFVVDNGNWKWTCIPDDKYPEMIMLLGVDNIESIHYREDKSVSDATKEKDLGNNTDNVLDNK